MWECPNCGFSDALVGLGEIMAMLNLSREAVYKLSRRADWPEPFGELVAGRVWTEASVLEWAERNNRSALPVVAIGLPGKKGKDIESWMDDSGGYSYAPPNPVRPRKHVGQPFLSRHMEIRQPLPVEGAPPVDVGNGIVIRQLVGETDEHFAERIVRAREYQEAQTRAAELAAFKAGQAPVEPPAPLSEEVTP